MFAGSSRIQLLKNIYLIKNMNNKIVNNRKIEHQQPPKKLKYQYFIDIHRDYMEIVLKSESNRQ